jgi:rubrerythrin
MKNEIKIHGIMPAAPSRRRFLKVSGLALAGTGLLVAGCNDDDDNNGEGQPTQQLPGLRNGVFDFGNGDLGVLTYAYALEQLEADFYTNVVNNSNFGSTFNSEEQSVLVDLYNHEVIHREFFRQILNNTLPNPDLQLLPNLTFNYGSMDFGNRDSVLTTAAIMEDTGIAAYNGSGKLLVNPDNLLLAGKIVSVEARHASAIRSLLNPNSGDFAPNPLDLEKDPSEVISAVNQLDFIETAFTASYLP